MGRSLTALHFAATNGQTDTSHLLLHHSPPAKAHSPYGTAPKIPWHAGHKDTVRVLEAAGDETASARLASYVFSRERGKEHRDSREIGP